MQLLDKEASLWDSNEGGGGGREVEGVIGGVWRLSYVDSIEWAVHEEERWEMLRGEEEEGGEVFVHLQTKLWSSGAFRVAEMPPNLSST